MSSYRIDHCTGPIKNAGWRIYKASWQTHRDGLPIKRKAKDRMPRWKFISVWDTEDEAKREKERLENLND